MNDGSIYEFYAGEDKVSTISITFITKFIVFVMKSTVFGLFWTDFGPF